jgi:hypothetical protein
MTTDLRKFVDALERHLRGPSALVGAPGMVTVDKLVEAAHLAVDEVEKNKDKPAS